MRIFIHTQKLKDCSVNTIYTHTYFLDSVIDFLIYLLYHIFIHSCIHLIIVLMHFKVSCRYLCISPLNIAVCMSFN